MQMISSGRGREREEQRREGERDDDHATTRGRRQRRGDFDVRTLAKTASRRTEERALFMRAGGGSLTLSVDREKRIPRECVVYKYAE